ncbi:hypothetical protein [Chitinimonas sp. BJB300]|uniref:hypothetical protein n=1 Tax=Chitinimonas sp. BJB300 TaxID=1559339 RepID=UPI0013045821|nr:hypothetical protein [Chitinimonas sp. BJB300]
MKKTDLEKLRGLKINEKLAKSGNPERFGKHSGSQQTAPEPKGLLGALLKKSAK